MMNLFLRATIKLERFVKFKNNLGGNYLGTMSKKFKGDSELTEQSNQSRKGRDHYFLVLNKILNVLMHKGKFYTLKDLQYYWG